MIPHNPRTLSDARKREEQAKHLQRVKEARVPALHTPPPRSGPPRWVLVMMAVLIVSVAAAYLVVSR